MGFITALEGGKSKEMADHYRAVLCSKGHDPHVVAIGLNTKLRQLIANGLRPIILGMACWFAVAVVSLLVQFALGIL